MRKKRTLAALLALCLALALPGCQGQEEQDAYYASLMAQRAEQLPEEPDPSTWRYLNMEPQPGDTLQGEITVRAYTVGSNVPLLNTLANEFMFRHPAVKINVEWVMDYIDFIGTTPEEKAVLRQEFDEELRLTIATGTADYVFFDEGSIDLDVATLSTSGALEDFGPYLREDFPEGFFYEDVLQAFQVDGRQTVLPLSVSYSSIAFDRAWLEKLGIDEGAVDKVSTTQVMDWYEQALELDPELGLFFNSPRVDQMFDLERTAYMDLIDRTCTFASEPFVKYLTQLLDIQNDEPLLDDGLAGSSGIDYFSVYQLYQHTGTLRGDYQNLVNDPNPVNDGTREMVKIFYDAKPALAVLDWARPHTVLTQWQPLDYLAGPYPLTNSKGEIGVATSESFLLPSSMQNKDLAWEFIKFCMGEREDPRVYGNGPPHYYTPFFPINRYNLGTMAEDVSNGEGLGSTSAPFDTGIFGMDPQLYIDAVEELFTGPMVPVEYYEIDTQEFIDEMYLHRLTTPEECAEKIQGRATLQLNE